MGAIGGGVLILIAVILWSLILVPRIMQNRNTRTQEKQAQKLEKTMLKLEAVAQETAEDRLIATARAALTREKMLQLKMQRERAEKTALLAQAKAEQQVAKLQAKRAASEAKAKLRSEKLAGASFKKLRIVLAALLLVSAIALLIGLGMWGSGLTAMLAGVSLAVGIVSLCGLVVLAPGRAQSGAAQVVEVPVKAVSQSVRAAQVASAAQQLEAEMLREQAQQAAATQAAKRLEREQYEAAQQAAAAQLARAKARSLARTKQRGAHRNNQEGLVLLTDVQQNTAANLNAVAAAVPTNTVGNAQQAERSATSRVLKPRPVPVAELEHGVTEPAGQHSLPQAESVESEAVVTLTAAQRERQELALRLRNMGVLPDLREGAVDLDAALRRRRG